MKTKKNNHHLKQSIFLNTINHRISLKFLLKTTRKGSKKHQVPLLLKDEQSLALTYKKIQKSSKEKLQESTIKKHSFSPASNTLKSLCLEQSRSFSFKRFFFSSLFYGEQLKVIFGQETKTSFFKEQHNIAHARTNIELAWWNKKLKDDD